MRGHWGEHVDPNEPDFVELPIRHIVMSMEHDPMTARRLMAGAACQYQGEARCLFDMGIHVSDRRWVLATRDRKRPDAQREFCVLMGRIDYGDGLEWCSGRFRISGQPALPDTAMLGLAGEPLSMLVRHPMLPEATIQSIIRDELDRTVVEIVEYAVPLPERSPNNVLRHMLHVALHPIAGGLRLRRYRQAERVMSAYDQSE